MRRRIEQCRDIVRDAHREKGSRGQAGDYSAFGKHCVRAARSFRVLLSAWLAVSLAASLSLVSFFSSAAGPATGIVDETEAHADASGRSGEAVVDAASWGIWQQDKFGWWFRFNDGTYPTACWLKINGSWYYFRESGYMATGPLELDGVQYYLDSSGAMAESIWVEFREELYYFTADGSMAKSTWVDDVHYVDSEGRMVKDKWVDGIYIDEEGVGEHPDAHFFD